MALVVGAHFLPIAFAASFRPFYLLGAALILAAIAGFVVRTPAGGEIAALPRRAPCGWLRSPPCAATGGQSRRPQRKRCARPDVRARRESS
jgi:hypothetical protein